MTRGSARAGKAQTQRENAAKSKSPILSLSKMLDQCPVCNNSVKISEKGVNCNDCKQWWHAQCCDIDDAQYEWLTGNNNTGYDIKFSCKNCREKEDEREETDTVSNAMLYKQMQEMMKTMNRVASNYDELKAKNESLHERVKKLEKSSGANSEPQGNLKEFVVEKVNEAMIEAREKEYRKLNLIMVNLPENPGDDSVKNDTDAVTAKIKGILPDEDVHVSELVRIGKANIGTAPRMVKFKVESVQLKKKILSNSQKLNEGSEVRDPKKKLYINPDYTREERALHKKLREDLRNHPDRENMRIRGNKIVPKEVPQEDAPRGDSGTD